MLGAGEALEFGGEGGQVSGPLARMVIVSASFSSSAVTSSRWTVMRGSAAMRCGYAFGELDAVDGESVAGGNGGGVGFGEEDAAGAAHLLLEEPGSGVFGLGLEGVGADELGEVGGLMRFGGAHGAHLVEIDFAAEAGGLQRGFGTGEASADDLDSLCHAFPPLPLISSKVFKTKYLSPDSLPKVLILQDGFHPKYRITGHLAARSNTDARGKGC